MQLYIEQEKEKTLIKHDKEEFFVKKKKNNRNRKLF